MGCTSTTVKYILFFFNFFVAICGAVIFGMSLYVWLGDQKKYQDLTQVDLTTPCVVLTIAGAAVFIVAFLGCCGAIQESSCYLILYAMILLALLILEIGMVAVAYVKRNDLESTFSKAMQDSFLKYKDDQSVRDSINEMQKSLECCGTTGPSFYKDHGLAVPPSCSSFTEGCITKMKNFITNNIQTIMYVGIGVGIVQAVSIVFGLYYASHIRRSERNRYA